MYISNLIKKINTQTLVLCLYFIFISFLTLYKLDYPYFFTDEILYTDAGNEYYHSDFRKNLQHPFLAKYIVGFVTLFGPDDVYKNNVFYLRFPFALMLIISCFLVYKIINSYYNNIYISVFASLWYFLLPFTFISNRMVMLESPMHFFSLLFHFFFLRNLKKESTMNYILSGIFMGLAIASKIPALLLIVFSFIFSFLYTNRNIKNIVYMYFFMGISFASTYLPFLLSYRSYGLKLLYNVFNDVIISRNKEGKPHLVNGTLYTISPWWYYFYYISKKYTIIQLIISTLGIFFSFIKRNVFFKYWFIFFLLNILFFQSIPLKAERYISTIEIPLTILITIGVFNLYKYVFKQKIYLKILFILLIIFTIISISINRINQEPTLYNAFRIFIQEKTNNFTNGEKTYVYGSTRSMRWYKQNSAPNAFTFGGNFMDYCNDFYSYKYVAFDKDDLYRNLENNIIYTMIKNNINKYEFLDYKGFEIYIKKDTSELLENSCKDYE